MPDAAQAATPAGSNSITDVPGILVGHADNEQALTGCTVVLCQAGAVGGVDQRGGAPGTRETDALRPMHLVQHTHAVMLAGGSAFGLDAATGAMRWLEERGIGFDTGVARVPIVPSAILFDLGVGRADVRPDAEMGYRACQAASSAPPKQGNAGAGMGCTVGKCMGPAHAMRGGLGTASRMLPGGLVVGALVAVNAWGDVVDPKSGRIVAGARLPGAEGLVFADTLSVLGQRAGQPMPPRGPTGGSTVIGVVATNARLNREEANKVAQMAQDGLARSVCPAHTMYDGDTLFALALSDIEADVNTVGAFAAEVVAEAILNAVRGSV